MCYGCAQVPAMKVVCVVRVHLGSLRGRLLGTGSASQGHGLEVAVCGEGVVKKNIAGNNRLLKM